MSVITEVRNVPEQGTGYSRRETVRVVVFWTLAPILLPLLAAFIYGLTATQFDWPGQNLFWAWFGYLIGWPGSGA